MGGARGLAVLPEPLSDGAGGRAPALVLASGSPQRRAILTQIGVPFTVQVSGVAELTHGPPEEVVLENASRKARAVAQACAGAGPPVLGVDTIVALGARIFGKPADRDAARDTLGTLAGREHVVLSGVCLIEGDSIRTVAARTRVRFRALSVDDVEAYLDTDEWRDRAGGYAIQERGAMLVSAITGDYLNVVGLPVATLLALAPWLPATTHD